LFGSSIPTLNDIYNPAADRIIARLVLLSQGKPADDAAIHAIGEGGIRAMAGRRGDGSAMDPIWLDIASKWATNTNAAATAAGSKVIWWYADGPKAGRMQQAAVNSWLAFIVKANGDAALRASSVIPASMTKGAADTAASFVPQGSGPGPAVVVAGGLAIGTGLWYAFKRGWIKWPFKR
ncbi:MAG: hypothetical protein ACM37U_15045, partial [Gemmatimonas sp.]